jgi:hypothetical protein
LGITGEIFTHLGEYEKQQRRDKEGIENGLLSPKK